MTQVAEVQAPSGSKDGDTICSSDEALQVDFSVYRRHFPVRARFSVPAGGRFALFGPSGAGKSTVLSAIAGLVVLDTGTVKLRGRTLSETIRSGSGKPTKTYTMPLRHRRIGLLRQSPGLFPHLTVAGNIGYGLGSCAQVPCIATRSAGSPFTLWRSREMLPTTALPQVRESAAVRVTDLARLVGIEDLLQAHPATLSGGQRQRVALARVLASDFEVLLLDEPLNGLDATLRAEIAAILADQAAEKQVPTVIVTHDLTEAQGFSERIGIMADGELLQVGDPLEVVRRPVSRRVAEMVGYRAFVPILAAHLSTGGFRHPLRSVPHRFLAGTIGVHPNLVCLGEDPKAGVVLMGRVTGARPAGAGVEIDVLVADGATIPCLVSGGRKAPPVGERCLVSIFDPPYFDPGGSALL